MPRIAVEQSMSDLEQALTQEGYDVVALESGQVPECDCCCVSGQDNNVMGMSDKTTSAPVVNCHGMSTDEVIQAVQARV